MVAIAVLDDYQGVALRLADWSRLQASHRIVVFNEPLASEEAAARALIGFDVICCMRERTPLPRSLIGRLVNLRLIVTTGHRNAAIDVAAAAERGILVCGAGDSGQSTAELTFGLILALARNIPYEAQGMRAGAWQTTVGLDLAGRTLGIIGLGRLGQKVAKVATAFAMRPIAWSQNLTREQAAAHGVERVDKDELLARADFVTIHTRLSDRTRGLIGERELGLMKPTALLINTSRGPIVDEGALLAALRSGRIAGCGLDVFDSEPLPADHPLRSEPRALLTPHLGYVTEGTYRSFYGATVTAVEAWLAGKPVNVVPAK